VLKLGHYSKIINTWEVLYCYAEEGWRGSLKTDHVRKEEVLHRIKDRNILQTIK